MSAAVGGCRRWRWSGGLVVLAAIAAVSCDGSTPTGPSGRGPASMLTYARPAGPFVGAESGHFTPPDSLFEVYVRDNRNAVDVRVRTVDGTSCFLALAAPPGQVLTPGTYVDAVRYPFQRPGQPGVDFSCGRGCNTSLGRFVVRSVAFDAAGDLDALSATFEQSCLRWDGVREVPMERLTGEIRLVAPSNPRT